jgi:hypothetical protein
MRPHFPPHIPFFGVCFRVFPFGGGMDGGLSVRPYSVPYHVFVLDLEFDCW